MHSNLESFFSPRGGCLLAIAKELLSARNEVLVMAYSFTADVITNALIDLHKRGVNVQVVLDKDNEEQGYSDLRLLLAAGVPTLIDDKHAIMHNKVMVIDQEIVITGSFNFTNQAETSNAENLLVIRGHQDAIRDYRRNFLYHQVHSRPAVLKPAVPFHKGKGPVEPMPKAA